MAGMIERKMQNLFRRLDFDKDSIITKKDFIAMAERFSDLENADPVKKERLITTYTEVFLKFAKFVTATDETRLTGPILAESVLKQRNDPELWKTIENGIRSTLLALHKKEDGNLQYEEYNRMFANVGIPNTEEFTRNAFDVIDNNHDEKVRFDEFESACYDFFFSEDESNPFAILLGPV